MSAPRMGRPPVVIDEQAVLAHAAEAFATDGLFSVTMDDLAARAGVSKPLLYRRFGNKDDVFEATIAAECDEVLTRLVAAYDHAQTLPVRQATRVGVGAFFDYAEQRPHGFRLLYLSSHQHSPAATGLIDATMQRIADRVAGLIGPLLAFSGSAGPGVANALASALVGMCVSVARRHVEGERWDREAVVDLLADFMRAGLLGVDGITPEAKEAPRALRVVESDQ